MNITSLNEVADRKRMKCDVEKLREKISRENAKIIKLKVGQDTAYWELKEKLSSTEREHEALQRNMVELQMEHESVSAQHQDELRRRPETLNKLVSTREICDVLEENVSRVRASLQRSAADRAALADAYARAGAAVAAAHTDNERRLLAATNEARSARDLARLSGSHGAQLLECVSRERSRADQAAADAERLRDQRDAIAEHLARRDTLLQEREKSIQELRNELRRVAAEFNERNERARSTIAELEREAGAATALRVAVSHAEARGEAAARDGARLADELATAAADRDAATQRATVLNSQIQEAQSHIEKMKEAMNFLVQNGENLAEQLKDKDEKIRSLEKALAESQQELLKLADRAAITVEERERDRRDYEEREVERERERRDHEQELTERADTIEKLIREIAEMTEARTKAEATIAEQTNQIERERGDNGNRTAALESELAECTASIARIKQDIAAEAKARAESDAALANLTAERERERRDLDERAANTQRELAEYNDVITELKRHLTEEKEARARVDAALAECKGERECERRELGQRMATTERELRERSETITVLRRELAVELETRTRVDSALAAARAELAAARDDAARALDDVRHLKADARRKDDEAAKQMQIVLSIRGEKERLQEKINELQETIKNIQEITCLPAPAPARDPPEHDDNALATPPAPFRALPQPASVARRVQTPTPHRKSHKPEQSVTDGLYDLFSDNSSSMEVGDHKRNDVDAREASRRFEALGRGTARSPPPAPLRAVKRRHQPVSHKTRVPLTSALPQPPTSQPLAPQPPRLQPLASQPTRASEGRKFFKTRRLNRDERNKK